MKDSVQRMVGAIVSAAEGSVRSIYLYGSVVTGDFRPGWSDIDFIAFTNEPPTEQRAQKLLHLRRELSERSPADPYLRLFEGVTADLSEYLRGEFTRLVYWGTSGERITDRWRPDVFLRYELAKHSVAVYGGGDEALFAVPGRDELVEGVRAHYEGIRRFAAETDESLYSCGWLLDIARCIYTMRHNDVISKTAAGLAALDERCFDDEEPLKKALMIRREPMKYKDDEQIRRWLRALGPTVQRYADVLERELERT